MSAHCLADRSYDRAMRRPTRQSQRVYTTIDLGSVMNLATLPPAEESSDPAWDDDGGPAALPEAGLDPGWTPVPIGRPEPTRREGR